MEIRPFSFSCATLLVLAFGCSSESQNPNDTAGSGGMTNTGGASTGGAGEVSSGGSPAGGSNSGGSSISGGSSNSGGNSDLGGAPGSGGEEGTVFTLTSPAFENVAGCSVENPVPCNLFPDENVIYLDNANISPELHWSDAPPGTMSFALELRDATYGQAHWVLWNIPADLDLLAADVDQDTTNPPEPVGSQQANANFSTIEGDGYFGPHLPCNVFEFKLYALSLSTFTPERPDSSVLVAIELENLGEEVLGIARLTGRSLNDMSMCQ
jgi:phosphatidylethanolamine-binding protein (PEBP) family uncharacterized protein